MCVSIISNISLKIIRLLTKIRLRSIDVYVFHSVSEKYDPYKWWRCDWSQIDSFKEFLLAKQKTHTFISLTEAYKKLKSDVFRFKRYAVLTSDDGYRSILSVLPWLSEQHIPVTLFINVKYLDGVSWSCLNEEQACFANGGVPCNMEDVVKNLYITKEELFRLNFDNVSIGLHGYEHNDVTKISADEFEKNIDMSLYVLQKHSRYVPYYAYTWGRFNEQTNKVLNSKKLIPVMVKGSVNYSYNGYIDRICIDGCNT